MDRDVYSGRLKLHGEEHGKTLLAANNYANSLIRLERFKEARKLMRKMTPVAQRVLGEPSETTLWMKWNYAGALYQDPDAPLDDLREAVTMLEDAERIARRVFGAAYPLTRAIAADLPKLRDELRARSAPP